MTPDKQNVLEWRGRTMVDSSGDKIGTIDEIYEDTDTRRPEWALVHTGLLGTKRTFVPLREAAAQGDDVSVPYEKSQVKDAPSVDPDGQLSRDEEQTLYAHYGLDYSTAQSGSGLPEGGSGTRELDRARGAGTGGTPSVADEESGRDTDDAMTRSEEELQVGTTREQRGTARLRKYVETEQVQTTVPVQREEVRVEREPITDANVDEATSGPEITESEHEVTLHEERPVVEKKVVPKERVRLDKDVVTDEQTVSEEVRKEQIDTEGAGKGERAR